MLKTLGLSFLLFSACLLTVSAQGVAAPPERTSYLLGEVTMSSPTGQPYGSTLSLVKRTQKPAENKIVEVVANIDPKGPTKDYTTVFDIKGSNFTVKDDEGTFSGSGELKGKPWEWSGWKYTVTLVGERKGILKAEDSLTAAGLTVAKTFSSPDGTPRVLFTEDLKPITREMYEILHAKLFPK
ncbi:hypothetical protein BH10ACI3_BH10ACI3_04770 [soil metagenome]